MSVETANERHQAMRKAAMMTYDLHMAFSAWPTQTCIAGTDVVKRRFPFQWLSTRARICLPVLVSKTSPRLLSHCGILLHDDCYCATF